MQNFSPLFTDGFLSGVFSDEYAFFKENLDSTLLERLQHWHRRGAQKETSEEQNFIRSFFQDTWGYVSNGSKGDVLGYQLFPQYPIRKAGQGGGTGQADLGIAWFQRPGVADTLQVACEFKDIRSGLDVLQKRKGNDRSPVKQCADYLKEARSALIGNEPIQPQWAIVTDMNEFRLYYWGRMPAQYQRFVVSDLIKDNSSATFQRFVFWRIFQPDLLLTVGGPSRLERMLGQQWVHEKNLETEFYRNYQSFREKLYLALLVHNPEFPGTRGELVRISQRIVDRLIFILYCEDMGAALDFPHNLLRDVLMKLADAEFYQGDDSSAWDKLKQLFRSMANGVPFANRKINKFNGGLFAADAVIDSLNLPTEVFCAAGQNTAPNCATDTLLYLSANYNFGLAGDGKRTITLLTLGRIFEQSITELEIRAAEEDNKLSLGKLSKRKRDGVYYTPEWTTRFIIEETVGRRLNEIKAELRWKDAEYLSDDQIENKTTGYHNFVRGLSAYRERLETIRIVDPACGSGAFLIQALEFLLAERRRVSDLYNRITQQNSLFDNEQNIRAILAQNIFGVDINPESVELTKLALWLHTAVPGSPLTTLDSNIRCGNSLVGTEIYAWRPSLVEQLTLDQKERINAFDWHTAFPSVFESGGFDCVVGNPPYVKLQNFRRIEAHAAEFLVSGDREDGTPYYCSTRTGNFDLYLPFIEKGLSLLSPDGRMGYIAPSVWLKNEYGEALRELVRDTGQLERWVDFASYMVFDEAIVYTALQFFTARSNSTVQFAYAPDGLVNAADWGDIDFSIPYVDLPDPAEAWNFLPTNDRKLIAKLYKNGETLASAAKNIVVGIQTSADNVYHLTRIGNNLYRTKDLDDVIVEDGLMKPLVSGTEAERYATPRSDVYLLFPYSVIEHSHGGDVRLLSPKELEEQFPKGWEYLKLHEKFLRARESSAFDDDGWYRFGRNQNLDKQHLAKLIVAQTVPEMRVSIDAEGAFSLNNVRVNGILGELDELWYLLGILNTRVTDFVFRRIAKPKAGGYFEANKQFIAPLPVPIVSDILRKQIVELAQSLQIKYTSYRDQTLLLEKRLASCQWQQHKDFALWPAIPSTVTLKTLAPKRLSLREITAWAKAEHRRLTDEAKNALLARLAAAEEIDIDKTMLSNDELSLRGDGATLLDGIFFDPKITLRHFWWMKLSRDWRGADKLFRDLLKEPVTDNLALRTQVESLTSKLDNLYVDIKIDELRINELVSSAFGISKAESNLIACDPRRLWR